MRNKKTSERKLGRNPGRARARPAVRTSKATPLTASSRTAMTKSVKPTAARGAAPVAIAKPAKRQPATAATKPAKAQTSGRFGQTPKFAIQGGKSTAPKVTSKVATSKARAKKSAVQLTSRATAKSKPPGRIIRRAKFSVGQVVRHRIYPFRGVVFDIDPVFANTDEWLNAIPPDVRPRRNQPFYHLLAESAETEYIAYVSEQNLVPDETGQPLRHPQITEYFTENDDGTLRSVFLQAH